MNIPMVDKCPNYNLYISGFIALRRPKALRNCNITHIVSVLEWQFEQDNPLTRGFQHLHIPVDDVEDENLLVWFPRSNVFIQEGLNHSRTSHDAESQSELEGGDPDRESGVLIHCAMGKSRSSTVLIAYLLWSSRQRIQPSQTSTNDPDMVSLPPKPLSVIDALTLLRQGRPIAEPNEGFMDQLYLYVDMGCPSTQSELESHKLYRRWMNKRNVAESLRINQAPDMVDIKFEDEDDDTTTTTKDNASADKDLSKLSISDSNSQETIAPGISAPTGTEPPSQHPNANSLASTTSPSKQPESDLLVKCRRCRHLLARSNFILPHAPLHSDPSSVSQRSESSNPATQYPNDGTSPHASDPSLSTSQPSLAPQCAHIFLHPLSWMKPALSSGALDGKLQCPNKKCTQNIGKFAWQGLRCSCGGWVTPGFGVARGKVDEITVDLSTGGTAKARAGQGTGVTDAGGGALRLPPGMRRGGNL